LIAQTQLLSNNLGGLTNELQKNINKALKDFGLGNIDLAQLGNQLQSFGAGLLKDALGVATGIANFLIQLLLLLIISFSLLAGREFRQAGHKGLIAPEEPARASMWQRMPDRARRYLSYMRL